MQGKFSGKSTLTGKLSVPIAYSELDTEMSNESVNPVQNKVIKDYIDRIKNGIDEEILTINEKLENTKDIFFINCSLENNNGNKVFSDVTIEQMNQAIQDDMFLIAVLDYTIILPLAHHSNGNFVFQVMSSDGLIEVVCIENVWSISYLDFVSAYKEMDLTDEQKEIARNNIGIENEIFIAKYGETTNEEIVEAYTAGKMVYCNYADTYLGYLTVRNSLTQQVFMSFVGGGVIAVFICNNDSWIFGQLHIPTVAKSAAGNLAQLNADGNIVDSGKTINDLLSKEEVWEEIENTTLNQEKSFVEIELPEGYKEYVFEIYSPMLDATSPAFLYPYINYNDAGGAHTAIVLPQWNYATGMQSHWLTISLKTRKVGEEIDFQIESISRIAANTNSHNPHQGGEVQKTQWFNSYDDKELAEWARIRYERRLISGTQYKLYGKK